MTEKKKEPLNQWLPDRVERISPYLTVETGTLKTDMYELPREDRIIATFLTDLDPKEKRIILHSLISFVWEHVSATADSMSDKLNDVVLSELRNYALNIQSDQDDCRICIFNRACHTMEHWHFHFFVQTIIHGIERYFSEILDESIGVSASLGQPAFDIEWWNAEENDSDKSARKAGWKNAAAYRAAMQLEKQEYPRQCLSWISLWLDELIAILRTKKDALQTYVQERQAENRALEEWIQCRRIQFMTTLASHIVFGFRGKIIGMQHNKGQKWEVTVRDSLMQSSHTCDDPTAITAARIGIGDGCDIAYDAETRKMIFQALDPTVHPLLMRRKDMHTGGISIEETGTV